MKLNFLCLIEKGSPFFPSGKKWKEGKAYINRKHNTKEERD
jgi:hypothetical protein